MLNTNRKSISKYFLISILGDEGIFGVSNLFGNVKAIQIAATSKGMVGLTKEGKLFQFGYQSEQKGLVFANLDFVFSLIHASLDGNSLIGISSNMIVHWEFSHEHATIDQPFDILRLREPLDIIKIEAGQGHFMLLTKSGDVYTWSLGKALYFSKLKFDHSIEKILKTSYSFHNPH